MSLVFVFDKFDNGTYSQNIKCEAFRPSPFAEYLLKSATYNDIISFTTLSEQASYRADNQDKVLIYPIGVFLHFHHSMMNCIADQGKENEPISEKFSELASIDKLYIMIDLSWEIPTLNHLKSLPRIFAEAGFPISRVIFISSQPRSHLMTDLAYQHGIVIIGTSFFEYYVHDLHRNQFAGLMQQAALKQQRCIDPTSVSRSFICLNRRMRHHRLMTAAYLHRHNLLCDGFVSFGGSEVEPDVDQFNDQIVEETRLLVSASSLTGILEPGDIDNFLSVTPLELDLSFSTSAMQKNSDPNYISSVLKSSDPISKFYEQSIFSIIPETWYGHTSFTSFLTEKTFKPILNFHPFILVGAPGILEDLRELGYQTFAPIFEESYDGILNPSERFASTARSIHSAINSIHNNPSAIIPHILRIAEHNIQNFISGTPKRVRGFLHKLELEIRKTSSYVFSEIISSDGVSRSPGDIYGKLVEFSGRQYCRILSSSSPFVVFQEGFHDPERHGRGCWSGKKATLILRLGVGEWEVILSSWSGVRHNPPKMTIAENVVLAEWIEGEGRDHAKLSVTLTKPILEISFEVPWAKIPDGQHRELGFWLFDDLLVSV